MAIHNSVPKVTMAQCRDAIVAAMSANVATLLIGDPGVGKSALANEVAATLGTSLETLIGSTLDPTDVGGLPVVRVDGKGIDRVPLSLIRKLCREPGILFLDEIACAPPAVQSAMLRLILERVAGDEKLHPETRVIGATNPAEQSPGGSELSAPLIGRVMLLHLRPSADEVLSFFMALGEDGTALRNEAVDFAVTCAVAPELLQIDIPEHAQQGNVPWGAPRAWERVCRVRAQLEGANQRLLMAVTAGSIGTELANTYRGIQEVREHLPSVDQILSDPKGTRVPEDRKHQIGAIGLVARVAERDAWAAYIYAARLLPELRAAGGKLLARKKVTGEGSGDSDTSPFLKDGKLARLEILRALPKAAG